MKRICCFLECWESGGIESFLYNVLTRIEFTHLQVDIVASCLGRSVFTKPLRELGVGFFELSGSQRKVTENRRRFRALMRERQWDVLHLNAFQGLSLYYLRLAEEAGVPVRIAHSHNTALRKSLTRPIKQGIHTLAKEWYTRYATELWACSQDAAEFLFSAKELKQNGFRFIPNGIDTERFRFDPSAREAVRSELGLADKFVIGNAGRLCYQKNQEFLLDVLVEVLKREPDGRLMLIGEGADKSMLVRKAERLRISDKVLLCGVSDHVERLLWAMDTFAFPSRFEGLGIVAIEAQAAGLQVVCSENIPAEAEVTGLFRRLPLSAGAERWAERLLEMPARQIDGADAVKERGFDIAAVTKRIEECYMGAETR